MIYMSGIPRKDLKNREVSMQVKKLCSILNSITLQAMKDSTSHKKYLQNFQFQNSKTINIGNHDLL